MYDAHNLIIDSENNRFKTYVKFLGFKVGEWKELPQFTFIAITKVRFSKTVSSPKLMGNQNCTSNFSDYKFCVFLCIDSRKKYLVFKGDYEDAIKVASSLKDYLKISVEDFVKLES
ncbi:MAG: hypothetical protein H6586_05450 [Flavobacteriales bacterium]|nr:hypothetical protein [Flavobacteriales bacterium]